LFADDCAGWRVTVGGADTDVRSVLIQADDVRDIEFVVESGPKCRWWLPPLAEVNEGDAALDLLIRAAEGA